MHINKNFLISKAYKLRLKGQFIPYFLFFDMNDQFVLEGI